MTELIPILVLLAFVAVFGVILVIVSGLFGPNRRQSEITTAPYECGLPGIEKDNSKIPIKYYLTAILFILFDIEIIFMYPWAITYTDFIAEGQGIWAFSAMAIFILVFIFGLFWEIKSRALDWD